MAENKAKSFSKTNSANRQAMANTKGTSATKNINLNRNASDLMSREEEYKRLNEELEARTASLVQEAETVIREQENIFSKPSLLGNINTDDFFEDWDEEQGAEDVVKEEAHGNDKQRSSRSTSSQVVKATNQMRTQSGKSRKPTSARIRTKSKSLKSNLAAEDVAVPDEAFLTEYRDYSLQKTISNLEGRVDRGERLDDEDDVMPSAAADMAAEAQIRFLKAKLRVMQEELDRLSHECNKKEEENATLTSKMKDAEDERSRLSRTNASQQTQMDKYKRMAEDAKGKAESLDNQLSGLRKELDTLRTSQKQQASTQSATEVRLNRALEEVEKYKSQLSKSKTQSKDSSDQEKRKVEQLMAENKRLEKQKNELMTGFKKQLKLIDILKRQKMHIEAAKMLAFTEEEFVKALEWGN